MRKKTSKTSEARAFTLVEVTLVIVILLLAFGFFTLYTQTSQVRADVNTQAEILVSYLRLAQSNAMSGNISDFRGMHLETDNYTMFNGAAYNPLDTSNYTIDLPPTVTIENITLNGAGSDVIFSTPEGETATYGNFNITSDQINKTITINISQLGTVTY